MPTLKVLELSTISRDPDFHGWPTVARRRNGELLVAHSGGRQRHVCPFGQVHLIRSSDDGATWSDPAVIADGPLDDRDASVLETAHGTLIVTSFTGYNPTVCEIWRRQIDEGEPPDIDPARVRAWREMYEQMTPGVIRKAFGHWLHRSTDGGATWEAPIDVGIDAPHGPIELGDGRLFYAGRLLPAEPTRPGRPFYIEGKRPDLRDRVNGVMQSMDDGLTWEWITDLPVMDGHDPFKYHEWHAVETADGRIVAQCRNHNAIHEYETLQCESADGGQTWSPLHTTGVWGYPSHLLRLRDDRLLMATTHRRDPWSCQAWISADHGATWSEPAIVSGDAREKRDMGYPSTVQLGDGTLLTVWYEQLLPNPKAVLRQARWQLG